MDTKPVSGSSTQSGAISSNNFHEKSIAREISRFTKREIDLAFQQASAKIRTKLVIILSAPQQKAFGRILIIASKKVGNAPTRNKLRRQFKAIFFQEKLYACGQDLIILLKPGARDIIFADLKSLLTKAIQKPIIQNNATKPA